MNDYDQRALARIMAKSELADDGSGCLRWTGFNIRGYGRMKYAGKMVLTHRLAYMLQVGPIPDGYQIDHVKARGCRHTDCVLIAHLEAVTPQVNVLRGDTVAARNATKTHCPQGHPYADGNVYMASGRRWCLICQRTKSLARSPMARAREVAALNKPTDQ